MNQLAPAIRDMTPKAKAGLAAGVLGTLVVLVLLLRLATAPSYETVLTGIDPAQAGKVTAALDEKGVAYELQNGGTALGVQSAQVPQARIALAEQGLPAKGQPGFELFDEQKLGTSDFQQKVNYQRALEGEIAKTIEGVSGVSGAQVQLVLPEDQLFAEDAKPATAAVLLTGSSEAIEPGSVRGMAQLVSSSVEGLALDKVTITDGSGQLIWPREDGDVAGGAMAKQAAEQRHDLQLESQLSAMLARSVGAGKAQVQVQSQLNVDKAKERKLIYEKDGVALRADTEEEQLESEGAGSGGRAGTAGNLPGYAAAGGAGGESNYDRKKDTTEYGVGKTVRDTEFAQGAVEKMNVAVVLDASVPAPVARELQKAVENAAGIDATRGDKLSMSRVAFAKPAEAAKPSPVEGMTGYAKWAGLGLGSLIFLFLVTRHLRRREREALGEPVWLREINAPQSLAALESGNPAVASARVNVRKRAEQIASKEPEKAAQQLRAWMQEPA